MVDDFDYGYEAEHWTLQPDDLAPEERPNNRGSDPWRMRKPVSESKFRQAPTRALRGSDNVILRDGSGHEIGLRALADIADHCDMPKVHDWAWIEQEIRSGERVVKDDEGDLWFWDEECGVWVDVPRSCLLRYAQNYAGSAYGAPHKVTGIYKHLQLEVSKVKSARDMAEIAIRRPGIFETAPRGLQFLNGFVYYDQHAKDIKPLPSGPLLYQREQYPFESPPGEWLNLKVDDEQWAAICPPLWHILTGSIWGDKSNWRALQQRAGLALFGLSSLVRGAHIWFVGKEGTGKNTIMMALANLFPVINQTGVTIHEVKEYATGDLERSRVNVCGEVIEVKTPAYFKDATADGLIPIRDPGMKAKAIRPRFWQMCASNKAPKIADDAKSILDRFAIVVFKAFEGPKRPHLVDEMRVHSRGLIAWAMAGMIDYLTTGVLEPGGTTARIRREWLNASNPVAGWVEDQLVPTTEKHTPMLTNAWKDYRQWCEDTNIPRQKIGTRDEFALAVRAVGLKTGKRLKQGIMCILDHTIKREIPLLPEVHDNVEQSFS